MTSTNGCDLSGHWTGLFNYPALLPTTNFEAVLKDVGGLVTGITTENGAVLGSPGLAQAVIEGRHDGLIVHFTKIYDDLGHADQPIHYEGAITESGDEISGRWDIAGEWSGTFLMVRKPGNQAEIERIAREEIPLG